MRPISQHGDSLAGSGRGLGFAEILAGTAIVAIGLVALASAIPLAAYAVHEGDQITVATFLAVARLEQIRTARWTARPAVDELGVSASPAGAPRSGATTTFPDEAAVGASHAGYSRDVRVTECGAGPGCAGAGSPELRQVTVTVRFRAGSGVGRGAGTKQIVLTTLMARR